MIEIKLLIHLHICFVLYDNAQAFTFFGRMTDKNGICVRGSCIHSPQSTAALMRDMI